MATINTGFSRLPPAEDALSKIANGAFRAYLIWEQRNYESGQQQQRQDANTAFMREQSRLAQERDTLNYDRDRADREALNKQRLDEANRQFLRSLLVAGAEQGALGEVDPSIFDEVMNDPTLDAKARQALMALSQSSKKRLDEKAAADRTKGTTEGKKADPSTVAGDIKTLIGGNPKPEVVGAVVDFMDRYPGSTVREALEFVTKGVDPKELVTAPTIGNEAQVLRDLETKQSPALTQAQARGVPTSRLVEYVARDGEVEGLRRATAQTWAENLSKPREQGGAGIPPDTQVPMNQVNMILSDIGYRPIEGAQTRSLMDLVDELLSEQVGTGTPDPEAYIQDIILGALSPQGPPRPTKRQSKRRDYRASTGTGMSGH